MDAGPRGGDESARTTRVRRRAARPAVRWFHFSLRARRSSTRSVPLLEDRRPAGAQALDPKDDEALTETGSGGGLTPGTAGPRGPTPNGPAWVERGSEPEEPGHLPPSSHKPRSRGARWDAALRRRIHPAARGNASSRRPGRASRPRRGRRRPLGCSPQKVQSPQLSSMVRQVGKPVSWPPQVAAGRRPGGFAGVRVTAGDVFHPVIGEVRDRALPDPEGVNSLGLAARGRVVVPRRGFSSRGGASSAICPRLDP